MIEDTSGCLNCSKFYFRNCKAEECPDLLTWPNSIETHIIDVSLLKESAGRVSIFLQASQFLEVSNVNSSNPSINHPNMCYGVLMSVSPPENLSYIKIDYLNSYNSSGTTTSAIFTFEKSQTGKVDYVNFISDYGTVNIFGFNSNSQGFTASNIIALKLKDIQHGVGHTKSDATITISDSIFDIDQSIFQPDSATIVNCTFNSNFEFKHHIQLYNPFRSHVCTVQINYTSLHYLILGVFILL